ncbi:MAG: antitoxin [Desulfurococcales archaeon ex4484_217_2]|nr:MAG: antitoxin [Desulfurococcales archaeon ex4484_217_2]
MVSVRDRIVVDRRVMGGKAVVRGTRISVDFILELLANGWSVDDIVREYPALSREDVLAALKYAAKVLRNEVVIRA